MMDKKLIEKYLKLYPRIDEEINSLKDDVAYFESEKTKYADQKVLGQEYTDMDNMFMSIKEGLEEKQKLLCEHIMARISISRALSGTNTRQKKVIELRFWNKKDLLKWDEIAGKMEISKRQAEYLYSDFIDLVGKYIN